MKFQKDELLFDSPAQFRAFINDLDLIGKIRFSRPVTDSTEKVMIRENILVRPSVLGRLHELEGSHSLPLAVKLSSEILRQMRQHIAAHVLFALKGSQHAFIRKLFESHARKHHAYILHAFQDRTLILLCFRLLDEKPEFFRHLATLGLLSLGIVLQQNIQAPFVNRHAFLAGFTHMLGLVDLNDWDVVTDDDGERQRRLERGAALVDRMGFVEGLGDVIREAFFSITQPKTVEPQFGGILREVLPGAEDSDADESADELLNASERSRTVHPRSRYMLGESLRIARFVYELMQNPEDRVHESEELVHHLAYNAARGYFHEGLVRGTLRRFSEYDAGVKRLSLLALVERKCLHGNHAWAYPKPKATQVLCGGSVLSCPHLKRGWNFTMISPQRAFGRLGRELPAGTYYKCTLERELPGAQIARPQVNRLNAAVPSPASIA